MFCQDPALAETLTAVHRTASHTTRHQRPKTDPYPDPDPYPHHSPHPPYAPFPDPGCSLRRRQLDYYFRIDTDTRFMRPHKEDFFDYMAQGNYTYGFVRTSSERGSWTEGLCAPDSTSFLRLTWHVAAPLEIAHDSMILTLALTLSI